MRNISTLEDSIQSFSFEFLQICNHFGTLTHSFSMKFFYNGFFFPLAIHICISKKAKISRHFFPFILSLVFEERRLERISLVPSRITSITIQIFFPFDLLVQILTLGPLSLYARLFREVYEMKKIVVFGKQKTTKNSHYVDISLT